jgi:hypothetical protein
MGPGKILSGTILKIKYYDEPIFFPEFSRLWLAEKIN